MNLRKFSFMANTTTCLLSAGDLGIQILDASFKCTSCKGKSTSGMGHKNTIQSDLDFVLKHLFNIFIFFYILLYWCIVFVLENKIGPNIRNVIKNSKTIIILKWMCVHNYEKQK